MKAIATLNGKTVTARGKSETFGETIDASMAFANHVMNVRDNAPRHDNPIKMPGGELIIPLSENHAMVILGEMKIAIIETEGTASISSRSEMIATAKAAI